MAQVTKTLIIEADWNDADYITEETDMTSWSEEDVQTFMNGLGAWKKWVETRDKSKHRHNVPEIGYRYGDEDSWYDLYFKDLCTPEEFDFFWDCCPHGYEGCNIHTIQSIKIITGTVQKLF